MLLAQAKELFPEKERRWQQSLYPQTPVSGKNSRGTTFSQSRKGLVVEERSPDTEAKGSILIPGSLHKSIKQEAESEIETRKLNRRKAHVKASIEKSVRTREGRDEEKKKA